MSEQRKTIECEICKQPFAWQKAASAGDTLDIGDAFGACVCPKGLAHIACAEKAYTKAWLDEWQVAVAAGLAQGPVLNLPFPGVKIRSSKLEHVKP